MKKPPTRRGCPLELMLLFALSLAGQVLASSPPRLSAGLLEGRIHLDGRLDEPGWERAGVIPDLVEQSPRPGEATPYRTEVRVLADARNLYLGIRCFDPAPEKIAVHTLQRDGNLRGDDHVVIVFDTFDDQRSGFFFRINAAGARQDGLVSGPKERSLDWDGIWDARTARTPSGWSAELVIPARSLRFTPGLKSWGFNVERFVARDRLTLRWAGATLDASFFDLKRAGRLAGVSELEQGLGLDVSPFSTGLWNTGFGQEHRAVQGISGVDVSYNVTPQLTGVLTVNTDFGETEVDSQQVNLTRFTLFFPEKRTFFSQGANQFRFALGLGRSFIPFFSRRLGLFRGQKVPIDFGLKLLGRQGPWGIALLDVRTREAAGARRANLLAGRITYDVSSHLRLGTVFTGGDPDGVQDNSLVGFDAVWQTSTFRGDKNLALSAWGARSGGDIPQGQRTGWGFRADYPNDLWNLSASVNEFGDALDPALGFLPRPGTRQYRLSSAFQPRPSHGVFSWVRQFFFESFYSRVDNLEGETESWRFFSAPFNVTTESGEHLEVNWSPQFEHLDEPFEIAPGVVIPPGSYHFTRYRAEAQSSRTRSWRVGSTVWFGEFFGGRLTQWEKFINWTTLSGRLRLGLNLEDDFGRLPQGSFVKRLWQLRTTYAFTPDLSLNSFTQFDSDSGRVGTNNRFRWTIHPGKDFFVVWNRNWEHPLGSRPYDLLPLSDQLLVKLVWTFRR